MISSPVRVSAENQENRRVILVSPEEEYTITLSSNSSHPTTFNFSYNASQAVGAQLTIKTQYDTITIVYDPHRDHYTLTNATADAKNRDLCKIKFLGYQTVLLNEKRAELEITSKTFYIQVSMVVSSQGHDLSKDGPVLSVPFVIILALCSLLPVMLLIPDAIVVLREQIDAELSTSDRGVYSRIFALLIPLLCIGLTFFLLQLLFTQSVSFFGGKEVIP
ncbi:MAG: hypothetical protein ACTSXS_01900 [Candidatus Thorarchaeota archaeon]